MRSKASHTSIDSTVDVIDERFLAPESMIDEIAKACEESGQQIPADLYETANVVYKSLAKCYASTIAEIEELTGEHYTCINIVGGRFQCGISEQAYCINIQEEPCMAGLQKPLQ